jgi:hypothetical protein
MVWGRRTERRDHHTMNEQQATPAAPEPAPEPFRYRVGQVWRTRGGDICTVTEVDEDDFYLPVCTDLGGINWHSSDPASPYYLAELISDPAAPEPAPEPFRYRVGQVWRTRGGDICTVTEVDEDDFYLPVCTDIFGLRWHPEDPENADYPAELISDPTDFQQ